MILTRSLWPSFPRPFWPACACAEQARSNGERRLECLACGRLAAKPLPAKLIVGEEACAAIERATTLLTSLKAIGLRVYCRDGALYLADATGQRRNLSWFCSLPFAFEAIAAALDVDPTLLDQRENLL